jgi:hypothetical protein
MFNTTILDVAIGLIFIYLLLSLMCTAANEIIELLLKKRAIDLERGIRELLVPGSNSGANDVVRSLYNHPLVNSLFGGQYENSRIDNTIGRKILRTSLPSYIPARNFSLALMDLILPGVAPGGAAVGPSGATGATVPSPAPGTPAQVVVNLAGGPPPVVVPPPPAVSNPSLIALRSAVLSNPLITEQIRQGLIPLLDAAGNDMARVRENIESWYNASMDRVSSWYKRRAQVTILILGLFVAVTVNVDTITIAKRLSTDRALRDSLVAASDEYAKAHASPTPTSSPAAPSKPAVPAVKTDAVAPNPVPASATISPSPVVAVSPAGAVASPSAVVSPSPSPRGAANASTLPEDCLKDANSVKCRLAQDVLKACGAPHSAECQAEKDLQAACQEPESPKCKYLANLQQIQALSLPIGWDSTEDPKRTWPSWRWEGDGGWWDQIYWHALGWILTALALLLGAPFWFDLLNKFIVIRSAVKPHEKSPEEGSKD